MHSQNISFKQGIVYNSKLLKKVPQAAAEEFRTIVNDNRPAFTHYIDLLLKETKHPTTLELTPIIKAQDDKFIEAGISKQIDFGLEKVKNMASEFSEFIRMNFKN